MSSGENEFYALVKGTSTGIGMQVVGRDLGVELELRVKVDTTAGKGIASRRGLGKVRHLHTPCLWVQKVFHERRAELVKIPGPENPSDMGTKVLSGTDIWKFLTMMGFFKYEGKSALALKVAS